MTSPNGKNPLTDPSAVSSAQASENHRTKSIATRLTEAEFAAVEAAATHTGKKVGEWLRDAALTHARTAGEEATDTVLLAELLALRSLVVNLFAVASKGPLSDETMRRIGAYADEIKEQKAAELLARRRGPKASDPGEKTP